MIKLPNIKFEPRIPNQVHSEPGTPRPEVQLITAGSLRSSAVSASAWTLFGFGLGQFLRLGTNIALAALLFEEAFALMAIVMAIIQGLTMFSDIGLSPSVVQNHRGDDLDFLNTAWTLQVIRGCLLAVISCVLAWPIASFYASNDPMAWSLLTLLPLVALGTLVSGFQSSNIMSANRHMTLGRVTLIELASQILGMSIMIALAWFTRSVHALAIGSLVMASLYCLLSHIALPGPRNRFRWDPAAVKAIIRFGKWVFLATIIGFFALQIDRLVFAKLFAFDIFGVYAIAASVASLTPALLGRLQGMIAFPLYARMLARKDSLDDVVRRCKSPMLVLGGYLVALSIAGAQTFVDLAYDSRYTMAGVYIVILAFGSWFACVEGIYGAAFLATGRSNLVALAQASKVIAFCVLILPAIKLGGFIGAVVAVAASDALKMVVAAVCARKIGLRGQIAEALSLIYLLVVGCSVLALSRIVGTQFGFHSSILLGLQGLLVTLAFAPFAVSAARGVLTARVPP